MSRRPSAMHGTGSRTVLRKRPCGHRQPPPFWQDRRGSTNVLRPLQNDSTPSVRGQHSIRPRTALRPSTDSTPSVHGQHSVCPRTALRLSTDSSPSVHGQHSVRPRTALRPSTDSSPSVHGQLSVRPRTALRDGGDAYKGRFAAVLSCQISCQRERSEPCRPATGPSAAEIM